MNQKQTLHRYNKPFRTLALLTTLLVVQLLCTTRPASAHVSLVRSEPADGAALTTAPNELKLWFSETISMRFSSVQLLDEQNKPLADTEVVLDPTQPDIIHLKLPPLDKGHYTVFWSALSETDGHLTQGFIVFSIGAGQTQPHAVTRATSSTPTPIEVLLRWTNLFFLASITGALALVYVVVRPLDAQAAAAARAAQQRLRRRLLQWASICAIGALLAGVGLLAWQVIVTQPSAGATANWFTQAWSVLTETKWGILWLVRAALLIWLSSGLWLLAMRRDVGDLLLLVVGGRALDLLIVQALSGHAAGSGTDWLFPTISVSAHLLAASIWMGSIVALVIIVLPAIRRGAGDGAAWRPIDWRKFSLLAAFSVGLLFASGLYTMSLQVASLDALLTTLYGQVLLGKVSLVLLAGLCGLLNAMLLHPGLATPLARMFRRPQGWTPLAMSSLPRLIGLELLFGVIIFAATGLLTAAAPPRGVAFTIAAESVHPWLVQRVGDVLITLEVRPNRPGSNVINVRAVNTLHPTAIERYNVSIQLTNLDQHKSLGQGETDAKQKPIGIRAVDGTRDLYEVTLDDLNQAGAWQIDVMADRNSGESNTASFKWIMPPAAELQPTLVSKAPWAAPLKLLALIILCLLLFGGGGLWWLRTRKAVTRRPAQRDLDGRSQPVSLAS